MDYLTDSNIIEKKSKDYSFDRNNFVVEGELPVTITLNEYRDLISTVAESEEKLSKEKDKRYAAEAKAEALQKKLESITELFHSKGQDTNSEVMESEEDDC